MALEAGGSVVKSAVRLNDGFTADGLLSLNGAQFGAFYCDQGDFHVASLSLVDASVGTLYDSGLNDPVDAKPTVWPQPGNLYLDGLVYSRISSEGQIIVKRRLDWLGLPIV